MRSMCMSLTPPTCTTCTCTCTCPHCACTCGYPLATRLSARSCCCNRLHLQDRRAAQDQPGGRQGRQQDQRAQVLRDRQGRGPQVEGLVVVSVQGAQLPRAFTLAPTPTPLDVFVGRPGWRERLA